MSPAIAAAPPSPPAAPPAGWLSPALPQLIRRLNLLDGQEHLRWLARPDATGRLRAGSD